LHLFYGRRIKVTDDQRTERLKQLMRECHPVFRKRIINIYKEMEDDGWRPRVQDAWRSTAKTKELHKMGLTTVKWSFHNAMTPNGIPESLAIHIYDDDATNPADPSRKFLMRLAYFSKKYNCRTGIAFGLPRALQNKLNEAIRWGETEWLPPKKIGWDACHVEPADLTLKLARTGVRLQGD
jgi:hypothetical protein